MSTRDPKGYYSRLGLSPEASADEIKTAYRRLAKDCHPDRNRNADATSKFQALTEAYEILSDVRSRAAYDGKNTERPDSGDTENSSAIPPVSCSSCGMVTAQPRHAVFRQVVSMLITTVRTPIQGIYCAECARKKALRASLVSGLFGWWGIPFGPIFTIFEIIRNASGGFEPPGSRESLQWQNALAFASRGDFPLAYALARQLRTAVNDEIGRKAVKLMDYLESRGVSSQATALKSATGPTPTSLFAHGLALFAVPGIVATLIYLSDPSSSPAAQDTPGEYPIAAAQLPQPEPNVSSFVGGTAVASSEPNAAAAQPAHCEMSINNGEVLYRQAMQNARGHSVEIRNGSVGDAIIKIRDAVSGNLLFSFFVEHNNTAAISGLPDGNYRIQYAFGDYLAAGCNAFAHLKSAGEFPEIEKMETQYTDTDISTVRLSYTLFSVPNGNTKPRTISEAGFDRQ